MIVLPGLAGLAVGDTVAIVVACLLVAVSAASEAFDVSEGGNGLDDVGAFGGKIEAIDRSIV